MFTAILWWTVIGCWSNSASAEVTITRDTNDLIQFSSCSDNRRITEFCSTFYAEPYANDDNLCSCQCRSGYVMYRDPVVTFLNGSFKYEQGQKGCVWYGNNHEGCTVFDNKDPNRIRRPMIIDLTSDGLISDLQADLDDNCLHITPHVRYPGGKEWTQISINFSLNKTSGRTYSLQWQSDRSNRYVYQGLAMRLDICGRNPERNCMITKIGGTYTDPKKCKRQTIDGRCCVFPFVLNGLIHNDCSDLRGFGPEQPWCPVDLRFHNNPFSSYTAICAAETSSASILSPSTGSLFLSSTVYQPPTEILPSSVFIPTQPTATDVSSPKSSVRLTATPSPSSTRFIGVPSSQNSRSSSGNLGLIIGIAAGLLVLLIFAVIGAVFFLRWRGKKKVNRTTSIRNRINEGFVEAPYASLSENSPRKVEERLRNHNLLKPLEISQKGPSYNGKRRHNSKNRSGPTSEKTKSGDSNFYDTVTEDTPEIQPASIYNVPEADYSLIATLPKLKKTENRRSPLTDDPSLHVYAVLERSNDPLKNPEPVDNDEVFVEANPLYTTNRKQHNQSDVTGRMYYEPPETTSSRNIYDVPESTEKGV